MNPNLPVGGSQLNLQLGAREALPKDLTQVALSLSYSRFDDEYRGADRVDEDAPKIAAWITGLSLRHCFGAGLSADLSLPAGTILLEPGHGEPTRRLSGFGDLEVGAGYDFAGLWGAGGYQPSLTLRLGLGLPTGRQGTLGDEAEAGSTDPGNVPPNILAIGYGAYSGSAELRLTQFVARSFGVSPNLSVRKPFGASESGVTMGDTYVAGLDALFVSGTWLLVSAGGLLQARTHSEEGSEGRVSNSGGRAVFATASASFRASERVAFGVGGRLPIYTRVQGQQIAETFSLLGTLSLSFGGDADEHEHAGGHEHGSQEHEQLDEHEHSPPSEAVDVHELAKGGRSFSLERALAPGKVTVIDFWADWCHSCSHVDARLRALAAEHPDLAVRRVEVPDFDAPVAKEHLPHARSLPELWIFDRTGKRRAVVRSLEAAERELGRLLGKE